MDNNVIKEIYQEHKGRVYKFMFGVLARNVETDSEHRFISDVKMQELERKPGPESTINGNTVTFTQAATRIELESGDTTSTLFGKLKKWLNDLRSAAFCEASESLDIMTPGYVVDSRAARKINEKFGGLRFYEDATGKYVVGADSVPKKLGSTRQGEWTVVAEEWIGDDSGVPGQHSGALGHFVGDGGYIMEQNSIAAKYILAKDYDIKTIRPDYAQLTADDFICITTSFLYANDNEGWDDGGRRDMDGPTVHAYIPETGILTVKAGYLFSSGPGHGYCCAVKAKIMVCA